VTSGQQDGKGVDDEAPIKFHAGLVNIFLTVRDGSRFVGGLTRENFEIYEDGLPQEMALFDSEDLPASVALLLDTSGSMAKSMSRVQSAAVRFVGSLRGNDEVMALSFGGMVREISPLTSDKGGAG
jgi:Ca-activated chloride channel homolog